MNRVSHRFLALIIALFTIATVTEAYGQRRPVTTQPSGKQTPCDDKLESRVDATPWKVAGLGFLTVQSTPVDTAEIVAAATMLSNAVGGDLTNYELIVDSLTGWMGTSSWTGYFQFTRTVTISIKEWKCVDGALVLVRDVDKTFDEKGPWMTVGPLTGSSMSVKMLRTAVASTQAELPEEYEGPIE